MRAIYKDTFKEITNTRKRFLSILIIVLLGVGFFVGIKATSPDMQKTVDKYFDDKNVMDIQVISPLGLTDDDIVEIKKIDGVKNVIGAYSKDAIIKANEEEFVVKIHNLSEEMNQVQLVEGRLPENNKECVVEKSFLLGTGKKIGDTIKLEVESSEVTSNEELIVDDGKEQNEMKDADEGFLENQEMTIVGTVQSPLYISRERGATKLVSGKINYFVYVPQEAINSNIYTEIYLTVQGAKELDTFSDKYDDKVQEIKDEIEKISDSRKEEMYNILKSEANQKVQLDWYILDRNQNAGFASYAQDSERIDKIGKVFPAVFFIIAALISLTSMTRMVEEQRTQVGTLKALGYTKRKIAFKYIIYATLATVMGGIIGMAIGYRIIPDIIVRMYRMMYIIPNVILQFNVKLSVIGLGLALICTVGATILACYKELAETPAALMRPKAPKTGKRVFLERINWIWSKLNFTQKVTVRNIFRYKKRVLMTIIGIAGCTALIVAGFGLRDSVSNMIPSQYGEVFLYDLTVTFKSDASREDIQKGIEKISELEGISQTMPFNMQAVEILDKNNTQDIQMIIPEKVENLKDYIKLQNRKTKQNYQLDEEGVILTEKLARLLDIKQGDTIKIKNANDQQSEVKVVGITTNYLMHYLYMSPELYQKSFGEEVKFNTMLGKEQFQKLENQNENQFDNKRENKTKKNEILNQQKEKIENKLGKQILENANVSKVSFNSQSESVFDEVMDNMTFVVWILIVAAGLLAFVVLYNLSNVNISERIRELATIKVLGFYDKEVYDYVGRETIILTTIGIALGAFGGYFLNMFILKTCELDILMFDPRVSIWTYVYSAGLTILFTTIVSIVTYFVLKKIDMIESLKSIE